MMLDWNAYRDQIQTTLTELAKLNPGTVRGYRELSDAGTKKDLLGRRRESSSHSRLP